MNWGYLFKEKFLDRWNQGGNSRQSKLLLRENLKLVSDTTFLRWIEKYLRPADFAVKKIKIVSMPGFNYEKTEDLEISSG